MVVVAVAAVVAAKVVDAAAVVTAALVVAAATVVVGSAELGAEVDDTPFGATVVAASEATNDR